MQRLTSYRGESVRQRNGGDVNAFVWNELSKISALLRDGRNISSGLFNFLILASDANR